MAYAVTESSGWVTGAGVSLKQGRRVGVYLESRPGYSLSMLTILLIVVIVLLLTGGIGFGRRRSRR